MKKNLVLTLTIMLSGVILLSSCDKKDGPIPPKSKEEIWYWGYFEGTVNGEVIFVENDNSAKRPIISTRQIANYEPDKGYVDHVNIMDIRIQYKKDACINIFLYELIPGVRQITLPFSAYWYESSISIVSPDKKYRPKEDDPVIVEIVDVVWLSYLDPIIEVQVHGTLYNPDDQKDTIIINGMFGTR